MESKAVTSTPCWGMPSALTRTTTMLWADRLPAAAAVRIRDGRMPERNRIAVSFGGEPSNGAEWLYHPGLEPVPRC